MSSDLSTAKTSEHEGGGVYRSGQPVPVRLLVDAAGRCCLVIRTSACTRSISDGNGKTPSIPLRATKSRGPTVGRGCSVALTSRLFHAVAFQQTARPSTLSKLPYLRLERRRSSQRRLVGSDREKGTDESNRRAWPGDVLLVTGRASCNEAGQACALNRDLLNMLDAVGKAGAGFRSLAELGRHNHPA